MPLRSASDFPASPDPEILEATYQECGDKAPEVYFAELHEKVNGGAKRYGGIIDPEELRANLVMNCLPTSLLDGEPLDYDAFLVERRRLMAEKIRRWVEVL